MTIRDKIRPFTITDYGDGAMLTLYSVEDYKQEIFDTRVDEGFTGSAEDWMRLAQLFISENMPELLEDIQFEPDADILTIYADDTIRLESLAVQFKHALDNDEYIYPLFRQLPPCPPAAPKRRNGMLIKRAAADDAFTVSSLAVKMWTDNSPEQLARELVQIISSDEAAVFILEINGEAAGFAQCQLRHDYVEGTESSPVGYLEGIYIEPEYRRTGYAKQLLVKCEDWAKSMGCTEFASDCEADNDESLLFHLKSGFSEANRIICFAKKL